MPDTPNTSQQASAATPAPLPAARAAATPFFVLTLSCPDIKGIVHATTGFLLEFGGNIIDSAQFRDPGLNRFFMRIGFEAALGTQAADLRSGFAAIAERFAMDWNLHDMAVKPRVVLMVSRFGHCLNDLLFRYGTGTLPIEIPAIISNHRDFYRLAASYDIPFHHLPVTAATKEAQERHLVDIVERERADLVVLARYMQVLSNELCQRFPGRMINIHHSFLPSFKGARPYHQAYARGVKLVGATAHYVTPDLDEGPIIEQDVLRVDHSLSADDLVAAGRDVEAVVLARALKLHIENRVLLNGNKTVVFR
ncbi:MAG: formyltetrahydrofolate deformylase [Acetobacteraceae bacterium]|nr:formyltetrahydrofolate deformylase [Acetobacteraceae bacterium]